MSQKSLAEKASDYASKIDSQKLSVVPDIEREQVFPIDALGVLAPAANAIADIVQVPASVAGLSVLTTAALAVQAFFNAENDGRTCPLSLFGMSILNSGDRKTASDDLASAPIKLREAELLALYNEEYPRYQNALDAYEAERSAIIRNKNGIDKQAELNDLIKPKRLPEPNIITGDPTIEGLQKSFLFGQSSQGLFTAEAGVFFGGHGMSNDNVLRTIAGLSQFWGGEPIRRTRAGTGESFNLLDRRLSSHLMMQPIVADKVLADPLLKNQGFMARYLMTKPTSLAGTRKYNFKNAKTAPELRSYNQQILSILSRDIETNANGGLVLKTLSMDQPAKQAWVGFYNEVELQLQAHGELAIISEAANKVAENALRIAGVLCAVHDGTHITIEHMSDALHIAGYFLQEQLRLAQKSTINLKALQANDVDEWIVSRGGKITINELQKNGPRSAGVRDSVGCCRALMKILVDHHRYFVTDCDQKQNSCAWEVSRDA